MPERYRTIVADPPWPHLDRNAAWVERDEGRVLPYGTMTLTDIAALPVYDLSDNVDHDAHLYLWTTSRYLPDTFSIVRAWGFHYAATLVWCKAPRGWSTGGQYQNNVEFCIFANRPKLTTRTDAVEVTAWVGEHAQAAGISEDAINAHMGTRRMAMWWISSNPRMSAVPSWDQWERLRELIGFGHEMDDRVREINAKKGIDARRTPQGSTTRWFQWPRGAHSAKPEAFLDLVEQVSPGPYLELFARRARFGWDYWGDESLSTVEMPA